jgi:RNA polymerase sigma factor (sigma-70 family)
VTEYAESSDEQLIAGCRDGDSAAWDALVSRYERLVYTIPIRYGLTPAEVDDVFQSTWFRLLKNLPDLRQPDRVGAWLVTTARRECWETRRGLDHKRTVESDTESLLANESGDDSTPEEIVAQYRRDQAVREAVESLDERCRRLLWHLYYDATIPSYAAIADKLKTPIGSVGPMRARCLKKLREILDESIAES